MNDTPQKPPFSLWAGLRKFRAAIVVVVLLGGGYFYYQHSSAQNKVVRYALTTVQKGTVVASVAGTGQVLATNQLEVMPQASGRVIATKVQDGDTVTLGQLIAVLDPTDALVSLKQAEAGVESAKASQAKVLAGATNADIAVSQAAVEASQVSLSNAKKNLDQVKVQQDALVKNAAATLLNGGLAANPGASNISASVITITGTYGVADQGQYAIRIYSGGSGLRYMVSGLENGEGAVEPGATVVLGTRGLFMAIPGTVHDGDTWTVDIPNAKSSVYLSDANALAAAMQTQTQAVQSAQASVDNAQTSLQQSQAALSLKQAAASPEDVAGAKAQVDSALAQVATAQHAYDNDFVRAPFAGKIAKLNLLVGNQASPSTSIATLITNQLYVQTPFNEVDAAKIAVGQKATVTFDAIDGLSLSGKVAEVDTVGIVTQGVVNYNVKVAFDTQDPRVKPGMSARSAIVIAVHPDVLTLPNTAVKVQGSQHYVQVFDPAVVGDESSGQVSSASLPAHQPVTTGLVNDSITELTGGAAEGDMVVLQAINPSSAPAAAQNSGFRLPGVPGGGGGGFRGGGALRGD